jgi:hypothetical protein
MSLLFRDSVLRLLQLLSQCTSNLRTSLIKQQSRDNLKTAERKLCCFFLAQNIPITSYTNGFFATDVVDDPQLLDEVPFVSNAIGKNIATASGFDTLSSGSNPNDTDSAIIGIHSTPAYGNQWGTQHTIGGPGLSAMGVLWKTDASLQKTDPSSGLSRTTRVIHLSTPNRATPHTNHRNTTICTFISAAVDLAVVYRNGFYSYLYSNCR